MRKGQIAYEYMAILGMVLLILIPLFIILANTSTTQQTVAEGEVAVERLASAAESVFSLGPGARHTVTVFIPEFYEASESTISGNLIRMKIYTGNGDSYDVVQVMPFNVTGSFPPFALNQKFQLETLANGTVSIQPIVESICGNNIKESGEQCDGSDLGGATCSSLGYAGGTLSCNVFCNYDTSACIGTTITYVDGFTANNGSVQNFNNAKSDSDGDAVATFTEESVSSPLSSNGFTLDANDIISTGSWSNVGNTFTSDDSYATVSSHNNNFEVGLQNIGGSGTINSVVIRLEISITGYSNDDFRVWPVIATTTGTSCDFEGSATDVYRTCNVTNGRPGGGSWSFADFNDTRIRVRSLKSGSADGTWRVDHAQLMVNYTTGGSTTHNLNITTNFTGVPAGTQELQLRYSTVNDTFIVQVYDGSVYNNRGSVLNSGSLSTWTYTLTGAEYNSGAPLVRFIDSTSSGTSKGVLNLEYERIGTT